MKYVVTFILAFCILYVNAQENLISNPSFEEYFDCEYELHDKLETIIPDWYALVRSPYYIRDNCSIYDNPNFATLPQDGNGFLTGINSVYLNSDSLGHQGRMNFQCELNQSIYHNSTYYLSFYIAPGSINSVPISHLGINFTDEIVLDPYYDNFPHYPYLQTPTIEIDTILGSGSDFGEWQKVDWCFSPDSIYTIMQIGYFSPIDSIQFESEVSGNINFTAYDNFEFYEVPLTAELEIAPFDTICAGECIEISTNHSLIPGSFSWTIEGGNISSSTSPSIIVCYDFTGTFDLELEINHCNIEIDTIYENAITVVPAILHTPPFNDTLICHDETLTIDLSQVTEEITWDDNSNDKIRTLALGDYEYTLDNGYCTEEYALNIAAFFEIQETNDIIQLCPQDTFWDGTNSILVDTILVDTIYSSQQCDSVYSQRFIAFYETFSWSAQDVIQCPNEPIFLELPSFMENVKINNEDFISPDFIENPGTYIFAWEDENNCLYQDTMDVFSADSSYIFINDLIDVELQDDLQINPDYEGNIVSYNWDGPGILSCYDCPYPYILSGADGFYTVEVIDEYNCVYSANLYIQFIENAYYLANGFSSNSSINVNQRFFLQSKYDVTYNMSIYDRWGNLIFKKENMTSNQANEAWIPGNKYNPQVFSYLIEIEDLGERIKKVGTITLLK